MVLAHLTAVALTVDPKIDRAPLLPMMDVWTKFKEGRSRRSRVIDQNGKGYRASKRTNLPIDRLTDMCKVKCPLFFEGWHNNHRNMYI